MYRMEKITTGAAYGASAGSILNGMLNAYSPEQWNAIGVLVGIHPLPGMFLTSGLRPVPTKKATLFQSSTAK